MKRQAPWEASVNISSDDSSDSDSDNASPSGRKSTANGGHQSVKDIMTEGDLMRKAKMYQEYMKQLPLPAHRSSVIPCKNWQRLAKSVKQLYGQPLHYLTNILLRQWDLSRIGSDDEHQPLDSIIHPAKAEALIWSTEEIHRLTSSHDYLAKRTEHLKEACCNKLGGFKQAWLSWRTIHSKYAPPKDGREGERLVLVKR